jgi:hypothetical protein
MTETKVVKVTKRMNINSLLARTDLTADERTYLLHELELIDKKNAYKESKKSETNSALKTDIFTVLNSTSEPLTCSKIAAELNKASSVCISAQRVSPQLKILVADGVVVNYKEKGVSLFKVAE